MLVNAEGFFVMSLRFGIREKFALFAIVLVLAVALALPGYLSKHANRVVEQHELVDLQDEAELRCWELIDRVNQLREQTARFAVITSELAALRVALQEAAPGAGGREESPDWRMNILAVQVIPAAGAPEILFAHGGVPALASPPAASVEAARGLAESVLSSILPLSVPAEFDPRKRASAGSQTGSRRIIPVVWAIEPIRDEPDKLLAIMLSLDRGRSPRHLSFLLDERGRYLMHPLLEKSGAPAKIYRDFDIFAECEKMTREQVWGRAGQDADMSAQRSDSPRERLPLATPFLFLEGQLGEKFLEAFNTEYARDRSGLLLWGDNLRMDLERSGVPFGPAGKTSNVIRLLARSAEELETARLKVEDAYRRLFPGVDDRVVWNTPVSLEHGDIQLTRFYLHSPHRTGTPVADRGAPYYFAYAAFREELASSIAHEMEAMRRAAVLLAVVAGVLAFLTAFYFVRPLTRITQTARSVTRSDGDAGQLQHQIEAVRGSLPVRRKDEVGDIARSLESLLRQVLNGHEQLRQLNADLDNRVREQTAELREANEQLRGLAAAKDTFLASVSHELRQPLNSIFGFMQFLELSELDDEQRRDMGKLRAAAAYLRRLIDDILDYQKIIMGGVELEPEPLDAAEFLNHLRESMTPQAQEKKNRLDFRVAADIGQIFNDRSRLQQVLVNLLSNACKFTQEGVVSLDARREKDATGRDWIVLDVTDSGRGMTPEEQQGLFVRFKKLSAREGNKTGTGLGLVISQGLCVLMGGSVACRSEMGKGSTFTVRVPANVRGEAAAPAPVPQRPAETVKPPPPAAPHPLVLVIDDDDGVRELMTRYLEAKGYRVMTAETGEAGVALAAQHRPSVITLDIVLAGEQNGWDVLAMLKASPATEAIPVIIITFLDEPRHGMALGAADYIVKPIAWDALSAALQKVMPGARNEAPVLVVDDDPEVRELFRRTLARDKLSVIEAGNGAEALRVLRDHRPSVILLDLMMPVMDGFEFVSEFNQHPEWHGIPIIVVTARHITREDREALAVSARAFLQKSGFTQEEMLSKVLEMVRQHVVPGK